MEVLKLSNERKARNLGKDIYSVNFADYLPETLKRDVKIKALAAAVTEQLLGVSSEIDNVLIYSKIDTLSEELLDILAFDMHVDWYQYSYPLEAKQEILKNSVKIHKKMGTKYAIETALGALHPYSKIEEWFEYKGSPFCFKIILDISQSKVNVGLKEIIETVSKYKRLSAHIEALNYNYKKTISHDLKAVSKVGVSIAVKGRE